MGVSREAVARPASPAHPACPIVYVVDDDCAIRESLERLIRSEGWQAETFSSAVDFLERPRAFVPSCLVLDLTLPDLSGLAVQKHVLGEPGETPVIFITGASDVPTTVQAMKAGAVEFLTKPLDTDTLLAALRHAIDRSHRALEREAEQHGLDARYATLSRREREVMALVARGLLNKQVGSELGISEITVKAHRGQVMHKMGARSLATLVNMAARLTLPRTPHPVPGMPRSSLLHASGHMGGPGSPARSSVQDAS